MPGLLAVLASLLLCTGQASAELVVHPSRIVLEKNQRSAQLEIINNSAEPGTYRITLVNRRMGENGEFSAVETAAPGEQFADGMLRYSPRRVTLAPGAGQVIRIMVRKPADLATGEYRSHLLFSKLPDPVGPATASSQTSANGEKIGVTLTALVGVSIPVIVRQGDTEANVTLTGLALSNTGKGQQPVLSLDLQRAGSRSVYGDVTASFAPAGGVPQVVGRAGGVAIYTPNPLRRFRLLLRPTADQLAHGTLTVSYRERPEDGGALLAEAVLTLP